MASRGPIPESRSASDPLTTRQPFFILRIVNVLKDENAKDNYPSRPGSVTRGLQSGAYLLRGGDSRGRAGWP